MQTLTGLRTSSLTASAVSQAVRHPEHVGWAECQHEQLELCRLASTPGGCFLLATAPLLAAWRACVCKLMLFKLAKGGCAQLSCKLALASPVWCAVCWHWRSSWVSSGTEQAQLLQGGGSKGSCCCWRAAAAWCGAACRAGVSWCLHEACDCMCMCGPSLKLRSPPNFHNSTQAT